MKELDVRFKVEQDGKGRCFLVASSPRLKKPLTRKQIDIETYEYLESERNSRKFWEMAIDRLSEPKNPQERLVISCFSSKDEHNDARMWAHNDNMTEISMLFVSKEIYEDFIQSPSIYKLEIAYKAFKQTIESRVVPK